MKHLKYWKIILVLSFLVLAGCQQENGGNPETNTNTNDQQKVQVEQTSKYGVPYSDGPTTGPETMNGPTAPPPENSAQAVTTKENIRLTLPRKVE